MRLDIVRGSAFNARQFVVHLLLGERKKLTYTGFHTRPPAKHAFTGIHAHMYARTHASTHMVCACVEAMVAKRQNRIESNQNNERITGLMAFSLNITCLDLFAVGRRGLYLINTPTTVSTIKPTSYKILSKRHSELIPQLYPRLCCLAEVQ